MADMHLQIAADADPKTAFAALTTQDGIAGWWTSRVEVPTTVGGVIRASFPDAPMTWDMRIDELTEPSRVVWHSVGGPPHWAGTEIVWALEAGPEGGTVIRLDHTGFAEVNDMFRIVTVGWAQMLGSLKTYLETGRPNPYFHF